MEKEIYTKEDIYKAMKFTEELANEHDFSPNEVLKLQLVTEEACTNSHEYCEKMNYKSFSIKWAVTSKGIEILLRQKGSSFPLVQQHEINKGKRGRGIPLILNIMDEVWVKEDQDHIEFYMRKEKGV